MGRRNFLEREFDTGAGPAPHYAPQGARHALHVPARTVPLWHQLALDALHGMPDAPPIGATLHLLHTAMYNAWAAYDDDARQTAAGVAVRLPCAERSAANKARAMQHAARRLLEALLPTRQAVFDRRLVSIDVDVGHARPDGLLTPAGIGRLQAAALFERHTAADDAIDGARDAATQAAPAHALPCHWYRLARYVSERDGHDDDQDVLLYFVLTNALVEAAEAAGAHGGGPVVGQGACAAAAAAVLRGFTGSDRLGPGQSAGRYGAPVFEPGWTTFSEAAEHGRIDAGAGADAGTLAAYAAGMALGRQIGVLAFDAARRHWRG